jgi:hypothetical protein
MKHALRGIWIVSFAWGTFCGATAWKKYLKQQHYLDNLRWELKWSLSLSAMTLLTLIWIKTMFGLKRAVIKHKKVSNDQGHIPMKQQQSDQHITRLFFIMILSFYICYIPDMVKNAYYNEKWTPVIEILWSFSLLFLHMSSVINPLLILVGKTDMRSKTLHKSLPKTAYFCHFYLELHTFQEPRILIL